MKCIKVNDIYTEFYGVYRTGSTTNKDAKEEVKYLSELLNIREKSSVPGINKAVIGWGEQDFSHAYIESFYNIANLCIENLHGLEDYYVYAVMYNYRQYLELSLKELILLFQLSFGEKIEYKNEHDLEDLVDTLEALLSSINSSLKDLFPFNIKKSIKEFHWLDPKNDAFRFAYSTNGVPSFDYSAKYLDLQEIAKGMAIIHEWFDTLLILFNDGEFDNSYIHPSYKSFARLAYGKLDKKSSKQIKNILKNIKFKFKVGENKISFDEEGHAYCDIPPYNKEDYIYFDLNTYIENKENNEIEIKTNHKNTFIIKYNPKTKKQKIISLSTKPTLTIIN